MSICKLRSPVVRRIDNLVVRISEQGIELRGYRCRRRLLASWAQIASLAQEDCPMIRLAERADGRNALIRLGVTPPKADC